MRYLGNNHVGFDAQALGFPSIKGCQAVVYQTQQGLFGFHDMKMSKKLTDEDLQQLGAPSNAQTEALKITSFAQWVQHHAMNHADQGLQIYGVILYTEQYGKTTEGKREWRDMLISVATALGFNNGPIYGVRLESHVKKGDSVYVRYDVEGDKCKIRYKRWSKMDFDQIQVKQPTDQQVLVRRGTTGSQIVIEDPYEDLQSVKRKGMQDEGNLNTVSKSAIHQLR